MSGFIDHLFSRSFVLDSSSQNVRPRLPSLFETPITDRSEFGMPFARETGQPDDQTEPQRTPSRIAAPELDPILTKVGGQNDDFQPSLKVLQIGEREDHTQRIHHHDRATIVSRPRSSEQNHDSSMGGKEFSHLSPLFKAADNPDRRVNAPVTRIGYSTDLPTDDRNRRVDTLADFSDSPAIAPFAVKPDVKTLQLNPNLGPFAKKDGFEPKVADGPEIIKDLADMRVDPAVLERIVADKIALHVSREDFIHRKGENTSIPSRTPLMVPADLSKLGIQWPSTAENHSPTNDLKTVTEPAEPVINVTIGRIEIRATPGSSAPVRKSHTHKPSTMSLDDYLNKRNGGMR